MNSNLVNTVPFHGTSPLYDVLTDTRRLRLISKLNKRYSIYQQIKLGNLHN